MKHLPLAVTAAAAVTMLGLPPARAAAGPPGPAGSCATITRAAGVYYQTAVVLGRAAATERAARDDVLAVRDDRASQQNMSQFYAAVGRGLARDCYLGHPATGSARQR
jgi:hypothetical protein